MRLPRHLPFLLLPSLMGCYETGNVLTLDAGPRPDAVTLDDVTTVRVGDPLLCDSAPSLPLDTRIERIDPVGVLSPDRAVSCFAPSGLRTDDELRVLYYRIEIPARTGVEVRTAGTNPPVVAFTDRCTRGASRCVFFQNTNGDSGTATSRRWYYGNPSDTTQTLWVNLSWYPTAAASGGRAPAPFSLETQSYALPVEASCETPQILGPDTLLPPSTARGGTYENWECIRRPEAHFVSITIPPRSQAIALDGSQFLNQRSECGCTRGRPFVNELNNFTDLPRTVTLERNPEEPIGVRYAPLPPNATCEGATVLTVAANEASAVPIPNATYATAISEDRADACGYYNDAVWYRVSIPAGRRVRVRADLNTNYPVLNVLNEACGAVVGPESCTRSETFFEDSVFADLSNTTAATVERTVAVAYDGPGDTGPLVGSIYAFFVD